MLSSADDTEIDLRPIQKEDWPWVSDWFRDQWLNKELGPMDKEWLDHVLDQTDGVELVAEIERQPIGLIGVTWCRPGYPFHAITDLAISPLLRRRGLGRKVLKAAIQWPGHPRADAWVAFTAKENDPPAKLLISEGWLETGEQNGMKRFKFIV